MKQARFSHVVVEHIPENLDEGILYVSERFRTVLHKCACGCGEEVVTPLGPAEWSISMKPSGATLMPSIGNWSFACQSHYFIRDGLVIWARDMSALEIQRGRSRDARLHAEYVVATNRQKIAEHGGMVAKLLRRAIQWVIDQFTSKGD